MPCLYLYCSERLRPLEKYDCLLAISLVLDPQYNNTVELGYNFKKRTEYFVSL
jgi:hypothetical protein